MKKLLILLGICLGGALLASTNFLQLVWLQPPGYQSALYSSTNLGNGWTSFGVVNPPFNVCPTGQVAYFYVSVSPANVPGNYAGGSDPTNVNAMMGSYFINTNTGDWWVNTSGGSNGWTWYIAGD
jgi:hypothetical protein